jgi:integration host factor subunit beta
MVELDEEPKIQKVIVKSRPMTRSELILAIAERFPQLNKTDCEVAVKEITDAIVGTLANGNRVEIRGFGSFALNYRPERIGRNPKSGEKVCIPPKWVPHFKPAKMLREQIDISGSDKYSSK